MCERRSQWLRVGSVEHLERAARKIEIELRPTCSAWLSPSKTSIGKPLGLAGVSRSVALPEAGIAITLKPALRYTLWTADLGSLEASGHLAFAPNECCGKHYENTGMAKMNFTGSSGDCSA